MSYQERYEDAVRRLASCGYEVSLDGTSYIVRHVTDHADISRMRDLNELVELANLFEWREKGRKSP